MIDTVVLNAKQYKIDGFRFDAMGLHFVYNMVDIRNALNALTLEKDGVDGKKIYMYGEGFQIAEAGNNAIGPNASQLTCMARASAASTIAFATAYAAATSLELTSRCRVTRRGFRPILAAIPAR